MRGKTRLSLPRNPPPDLVVEMDITERSIERLPIFAALGVPEIWHSDSRRLRCLKLMDEKYVTVERSLAFPFLRVADLQTFVDRANRDGLIAAIRAFRDWLRKHGASK